MYDKNHDGAISGPELDACPALKSALKRYDAGGGKVTADSIAGRINKWIEFKTGALTVRVQVRLDSKELGGATVTFDPEPFLGGSVPKASGTTDDKGNTVPKAETAGSLGVPPGLYKIRVSKLAGGKETIPAQYNANTTLGVEVAQDSVEIVPLLHLDLKSR